jgi:hypothetical protein
VWLKVAGGQQLKKTYPKWALHLSTNIISTLLPLKYGKAVNIKVSELWRIELQVRDYEPAPRPLFNSIKIFL